MLVEASAEQDEGMRLLSLRKQLQLTRVKRKQQVRIMLCYCIVRDEILKIVITALTAMGDKERRVRDKSYHRWLKVIRGVTMIICMESG